VFNGVEFSTEYAHELSRKLFREHCLKPYQRKVVELLGNTTNKTHPV
jgi:hypothetical protein